jgi:excisionase family DNA binding protein
VGGPLTDQRATIQNEGTSTEPIVHDSTNGGERVNKLTTPAPSELAQLYTTEQARAILQVGRSTMTRLLTSGACASVVIGRSRRIPAEALRAFIAARLQGGNGGSR